MDKFYPLPFRALYIKAFLFLLIIFSGTTTLARPVTDSSQTVATIISISPDHLDTGSPLTIKGTGFNWVTGVKLGDNVISNFMIVNDSTITIASTGLLPAGILRVSLISPGGTATFDGFYTGPKISAITPAHATEGEVVTITGNQFSTDPQANVIYFGAVMANASTATANQITVKVPKNATYSPVSVMVNSSTAYSSLFFNPTFQSQKTAFDTGSFLRPAELGAELGALRPLVADMDGDGKPDLTVLHEAAKGVSTYRNTSTNNGPVTFETRKYSSFNTYHSADGVLADFNGDGKYDVAAFLPAAEIIAVIKNVSTPGQIKLEVDTRTELNIADAKRVTAGDFDGDGLSDLAIAAYQNIRIRRNLTNKTDQNFTFGPDVLLPFIGNGEDIEIADLDNDGKPDLVATSLFTKFVSIYRNTSKTGQISFATPTILYNDTTATEIRFGDLDGDGRIDMLVSDGKKIFIYPSDSQPGMISFKAQIVLTAPERITSLGLYDLNGDNKLDIFTASNRQVLVFANQSTPGNFSYANSVTYAGNYNSVTAADLNGDSQPEIIASLNALTTEEGRVAIYANNTLSYTIPTITSVYDDNGPLTIKGYNFNWVKSVKLGENAISNFTIVNDSTITIASTGTLASGMIRVSLIAPGGTAIFDGFYAGPKIDAITPVSGVEGEMITITGRQFSTDPQANTIYFGAVKATAITATDKQITVKVPKNATYSPVSVMVNNATAYSNKFFNPTFPAKNITFNAGSFSTPVELGAEQGALRPLIADMDGDGKPDLTVLHEAAKGISTYRNASTNNGTVTFDPKQYTSFELHHSADGVIADFNGDGKYDVAAFMPGPEIISIIKNVSTPGQIKLEVNTRTDLNITDAKRVTAADFDGDGLSDLAVATYQTLKIRRSLTKPTDQTFTFGPDILLPFTGNGEDIEVADIDGDGKPDLVATSLFTKFVSVYRNTSIPGQISFAAPIELTTNSTATEIRFGDLDGDGKIDMLISDLSKVCIYPNQSVPGNISFQPKIEITAPATISSLGLYDLNGDNKLDIFTASNRNVLVFANQSTPGNFSYANSVTYAGSYNNVTAADLNGDNKPEIITSLNALTSENGRVAIYTNLLEKAIKPVLTSFAPASGKKGDVIMLRGANFTNVNSVYFGTAIAASYSVASDSVILAVLGEGATGHVSIRSSMGADSLSGFTYKVNTPQITGFDPLEGDTATIVTITGYTFTGTTAVKFGDIPAASFTVLSDTVISALVGNAASGDVTVVTDLGTASKGYFTMKVPEVIIPQIDAFTPASADSGTIVVITGRHFTGTTAVTFGGIPASQFTVMTDSTIMAVVGAGNSGAVEAITPNGAATLTGFTFIPKVIKAVKTYPNPANGSVWLSYPASTTEVSIRLVDMMGGVLKTFRISPGITSVNIDLGGVQAGTYRVVWSNGSSTETKTIVIMN